MTILVTGATGYIGKRLIPFLLNEGHTIVCAVRDRLRADRSYLDDEKIYVIETDFLKPETLKNIPINIKESKPVFLLSVPALAKNFRKNIPTFHKVKGLKWIRCFTGDQILKHKVTYYRTFNIVIYLIGHNQ